MSDHDAKGDAAAIDLIVERGKNLERAREQFADLRPSNEDENLFFTDALSPRSASSVYIVGTDAFLFAVRFGNIVVAEGCHDARPLGRFLDRIMRNQVSRAIAVAASGGTWDAFADGLDASCTIISSILFSDEHIGGRLRLLEAENQMLKIEAEVR